MANSTTTPREGRDLHVRLNAAQAAELEALRVLLGARTDTATIHLAVAEALGVRQRLAAKRKGGK